MGNYSKLIGSIVGGIAGIAVNAGLPADFASPEIQSGVVMVLSALAMYAFPANVKP